MGRPKTLIRKGQLARELGLSPGRISQLLAAGMPRRSDGLVNRDECLSWYAANVIPRCKELDGAEAPAGHNGRPLAARGETFQAQKAKLEYVTAAVSDEKAAGESTAPPVTPLTMPPVTPLTMPPASPLTAVAPVTPLTAARVLAMEEGAAIKQITRRKLEGDLLEREEVDRTWAELLTILKDRLRLIADNIAPTLASCTTEAECRSVVLREVDDALATMSKGIAELVNT